MSDKIDILWGIAAELCSNNPLLILQTAKSRGISFDVDDVFRLSARHQDFVLCPPFVPQFISAYIKDIAPQSILDAWAGIGAMLAPIVPEFRQIRAIALEVNPQAHEISRLLGHEIGIEWRLGPPLLLLDEIKENFDVVLGNPPWNMRSFSSTLSSEDMGIPDTLDKLVILKASLLLAQDGVSFFITNQGFTLRRGKHTVYDNLSRFGLFIDAILALPSGTLPGISLGGLLVIIRKQKPERLFVGELSSNKASNDIILKNLKARTHGKVPQHGVLVKAEDFVSFDVLVKEYEIKELVKQLGLPPTPLTELDVDINLTKSSEPDAFVDHPNALYLPIIGRSPSVSSLADLRLKSHNYAQIVIKSGKAKAEYLAHFFNTAVGQKIRKSLQGGVFIPKIAKSQLLKAVVYIPDLDTQTEILQINASIIELSTRLEILKRQLWEQPRNAKKILKSVKSLNREESFENWIESLPYPLASILWVYHIEDSPKDKVEHLLNFFEALSQFNTILMLSAYASDPGFYDQHSDLWLDSDPKYQEWYKAASFGNWNIIGERLAKATRRFLDDEDIREHCLNLLGNPTPEFIDFLTNKELFKILKTTADYRNQWKGHGGIRISRELEKQSNLLEIERARIQQLMADNYSTGLLLRAEKNEYRDGIYYYDVNALRGRGTPFKKLPVKTLSPMDTQKLYLLHENQLKPVEFLPIIRLEVNEEKTSYACYFYSRIKNNQAHYVSYHFAAESEIDRPLNELENTFKLLKPKSESNVGGEHEESSSE